MFKTICDYKTSCIKNSNEWQKNIHHFSVEFNKWRTITKRVYFIRHKINKWQTIQWQNHVWWTYAVGYMILSTDITKIITHHFNLSSNEKKDNNDMNDGNIGSIALTKICCNSILIIGHQCALGHHGHHLITPLWMLWKIINMRCFRCFGLIFNYWIVHCTCTCNDMIEAIPVCSMFMLHATSLIFMKSVLSPLALSVLTQNEF